MSCLECGSHEGNPRGELCPQCHANYKRIGQLVEIDKHETLYRGLVGSRVEFYVENTYGTETRTGIIQSTEYDKELKKTLFTVKKEPHGSIVRLSPVDLLSVKLKKEEKE